MKIAVYTHSLPPQVDGVCRRFTDILFELYNAGHEVVVFTLEKEPELEKGMPHPEPPTRLGDSVQCVSPISIVDSEGRPAPAAPLKAAGGAAYFPSPPSTPSRSPRGAGGRGGRGPPTAAPTAPAPRFKYVYLESAFLPLYPSKKVAAPSLRNMRTIWSALKRERPELVHVTVDALSLSFGLACKLLRIPCVGSIHTDLPVLLRSVNKTPLCDAMCWLAMLKEKMEAQWLDSVATTSRSFLAKLKQQGAPCDFVLQTGVQVHNFTPERRCEDTRRSLTFGHPDALLVLFVGRLGPEKGLDKLVAVCRRVEGCFLAIVGDGPMGAHLAAQHGEANRLHCVPGFLGHDELPAFYASADVHASCSHFETLGNTVLEAHASGIPAVVPRTQGFADTVSDGKDGLLFETDGQAVTALQRLRDDPAFRLTLGRQGRNKVLGQTPELVTRDMVGWYKRSMHTAEHKRASQGALAAPLAALRCVQLLLGVLVVVSAWKLYMGAELLALWARVMARQLKRVANASPLLPWLGSTFQAISGISEDRSC